MKRKTFHNYTNRQVTNLEDFIDKGEGFIPNLKSNIKYKKEILLSFKRFTTSLKNELQPNMVAHYIHCTKKELLTKLDKIKIQPNVSHKMGINNLKILKNEGLLLVPTDKNLGLALIDELTFNKLQLEEWENLKLKEIQNTKEEALVIKLKQRIYNLINGYSPFSNRDKSLLLKELSNKRKLPIFLGILKIHKESLRIRPVIRENIGPICQFSKALTKELNILLKITLSKLNTTHIINNSTELIRKLTNLKLDKNGQTWILYTADVKNMYPSISKQEVLLEIKELLTLNNIQIKKANFIINSLSFILFNNYFTYDNKIFHALHGLATGDPTSVLLASLFKLRKEAILIHKFQNKNLKIFVRYVDDIFALVSASTIDYFRKNLKLAWKDFELEEDLSCRRCNFLDLTIFRDEIGFKKQNFKSYSFDTKLFQKPQNLYQYQHWESEHPRSIYKGILIGELHRIIKACSKRKHFILKLHQLKQRLIKRQWPISTINAWIHLGPSYKDRNRLLSSKLPNKTFDLEKLRFKIKIPYNSKGFKSSDMKKILSKHWHLILDNDIYKYKPSVSFYLDKKIKNY